MGTVRLLLALLLGVLFAGQTLFLPNPAYAYCMCGQACPQRSCTCDPSCPHIATEYFRNYTSDSNTVEIRSLRSSALFTTAEGGNNIRSRVTLLAIPEGFVKLQCQRIKEMLDWTSDVHIGSEFQRALQ